MSSARASLATSAPSSRTTPSSSRSKESSITPRSRRLLAAGGLAVAVASGVFFLTRSEKERLSPYHFTPLKIMSVTQLTPETSLFKLALPKDMLNSAELGPADAIQSVYVLQPDLQIQRPYTPLNAESFNLAGRPELDLVVKRYPDGEVSRYLHRLGPGDEIKVRGPVTTWQYGANDFDEVVFIVGGTGVTPAVQYLAAMATSGATRRPAVSVIFSSPMPSRILLKSTLDAFAARHQDVKVRYLVDEPDQQGSVPSELSVGRLQVKQLEAMMISMMGAREDGKRTRVVVCGPEPMVNAVAGPRARDLSQGPVGGMLGQLGYSKEEVVKL